MFWKCEKITKIPPPPQQICYFREPLTDVFFFGFLAFSNVIPIQVPSDNPTVIDSINCPDFATNFSDCSIGTTDEGECTNHMYDGYVTCVNGEC